jgi:glycosyltransferase involved in cell wall biosynthesis
MSYPDVSVVIPVRNGARYLPETLASLRSQSIAPTEILVVDDGSSDATAQVAKNDKFVHYLRQDPAGAGRARNFGAEVARSEFLAFVDADDLWLPEKLALQLECLKQPTIDMVFACVKEFVSPDLSPSEAAAICPRTEALAGPSVITLLIRRSVFQETGGFPTDLPLGEFISWFNRATHAGLRFLVLPTVLARRRLHATNQGRRNRDNRSTFALIAKQALERKREQTLPSQT